MFSNSGHVMTLANSIIGVGILAMPFCFQKCGIVLAILLLIVSNWITRICCHYLIKSSLLTRRKSFEFLGFHAFGSSGKFLVELCIIGYLLGTCITYFVVVGDLGPQIVTKMLDIDSPHVHLRTWIMIAVTVICILPLGMLKNVDSLSSVFTASIGFYVCLVIKIVLESAEHIVLNDWTDQVNYWRPAGVLQCLPIFSMALSCQMQLFEVFSSINNQSLEKLNGIVKNATWICTLVYIAVGFFGYVAFCTQTFAGNILVNFSPSFGSDVIKIGFVLSVAFSFPLVIFPCRASIYSLLYRKGHTDATGYIPETRFKAITTFIVGLALCVALVIPSVELIIGLVGSTIGVAICIMFPAACFRKIVKKDSTERTLAQFIIVSGFCLMILGTYANLNAIDVQRSGAHLNEMPEQQLAQQQSLDKIVNSLNQSHNSFKLAEDVAKAIEDERHKDLEIPQEPKVIAKDLVSPPPFPVDEKHNEVPVEEVKLLQPNIEAPAANEPLLSPKPEIVEIVKMTPNKTDVNDINLVPAVTNISSIITTQGINRDAIKMNEEIAAEELKTGKIDKTAAANIELKKTQNELKKTKELLERKVDELKEELAKQTKETQNLVVEKLGEVVEKVQQIERDVQQKEKAQVEELIKGADDDKVEKKLEEDIVRRNKGSLMGLLIENANKQPVEEAKEVKDKVYEPLSYKTGELIENVRNASKLEQRLRMPLPLLINASQIKVNESMLEKAEVAKPVDDVEKLKNIKEENSENKETFVDKVIKSEQETKRDLKLEIQKEKQKKSDILKKAENHQIYKETEKQKEKEETKEIAKAIETQMENENEHKKEVEQIKETQNSQKEKEPQLNAATEDKNQLKNETAQQKEVAEKEKNIEKQKDAEKQAKIAKENETDKENVEAIRRDILQFNSKQYEDGQTTLPAPLQQKKQQEEQEQRERIKRSIQYADSNAKLLTYLDDINVDELIAHGASSAIDFKMKSVGRDLKSLKEDEAEEKQVHSN